ncbi:hypothetical protein [Janthinobacterium sp.]|uniref:hypothetical protein n=1 Tax=Janthinobacterium sp. TaxID=1871054 RepID=UPI0025C28D7F|nr:hypothetical protein [Janthinobacterium sp.]
MAGSGKRKARGPCPAIARAVPAQDREKPPSGGERRFADGVKTMVSGEANFVVKMSFPTSLIGGNDYVANPPHWPLAAKNIFHLQNKKFPLRREKYRQCHGNAGQMKRWARCKYRIANEISAGKLYNYRARI